MFILSTELLYQALSLGKQNHLLKTDIELKVEACENSYNTQPTT